MAVTKIHPIKTTLNKAIDYICNPDKTDDKELTEKKDKLYQEYGKLKKKVKQYDMIKQNVDSILRQAKQPERDRQTER